MPTETTGTTERLIASDAGDVSSQPMLVLDDRGRIVDWNPAARSFFRWPADQGRHQSITKALKPCSETDTKGSLPSAAWLAGDSPIDAIASRADGHKLPVEVTVVRLSRHEHSGYLLTLSATAEAKDLSPSSEALELARSAAIVNSTRDAIIARDLNGVIIDWNRGAELVYGYLAEEAIGQRATLIVPPPLEDEEPEIGEVLHHGRRLEHFETVRRRRDGALIDVSITVSPLTDGAGNFIGTATIERDITRNKLREAELRRAKHAAEVAQRSQQQFLANVSHELRTPMNAIIGMIDLALEEPLSKRSREFLETAHDSSRVMLSLVDDLLDYARMEAGKFELDEEPFSVRRVLDAAMRALSLRASEQAVELLCEVDADVPDRLMGDATRLRQVVTNLAGNALKFTEGGEVAVHLGIASCDGDSCLLTLTVRDTGIGILEEDQERIFQAFTQVDSSTTRRHTGAGLGLTICREIIERMDGRLSVESEFGSGSRFTATMRFSVLPALTGGEQVSISHLESLPVLVVDDNATNRRILQEGLRSWSMKPTAVESAQAALQLIESERRQGRSYPLLIVDGAMPDMDGWTLVGELHRRGLLGPSRVVMLSSSGMPASNSAATQLPIAAFLEKPVSQSVLFDAIVTAFSGAPQKREEVVGIETTAHPLRVLVAEDTPANRKVVEAILEKRGHLYEHASNGRQAVERCRSNQYDVVLMDVQMPVMDGLTATAAIRALPHCRDLPIVAMTAHAMRGDRELCLQAGMNAYIPKPVFANEMLSVLEDAASRRVLQQGKSTHSRAEATDMLEVQDGSHDGAKVDAERKLNLEAARRRLGGDEALLRDLAGFFLDDAPLLLEETRSALARNDRMEASRCAHSIKGLAANFDAEEAVAIAQSLETAARTEEPDSTAALVGQLDEEIRNVCRALETTVLRQAH